MRSGHSSVFRKWKWLWGDSEHLQISPGEYSSHVPSPLSRLRAIQRTRPGHTLSIARAAQFRVSGHAQNDKSQFSGSRYEVKMVGIFTSVVYIKSYITSGLEPRTSVKWANNRTGSSTHSPSPSPSGHAPYGDTHETRARDPQGGRAVPLVSGG